MKRRILKKQIPHFSQRLFPVVTKYLAANYRVQQDIIHGYQTEIEYRIVDLMRRHLMVDPSWPHRERWLDGLDEEYSWERKSGVLYGKGALYWGHWPEVGREMTGLRFNAVLKLCSRHGLEYQFEYDEVRNYSSRRWC